MVYLISYDIKEYNKADDEKVIAYLKGLGATRCLLSEWLLQSPKTALDLANGVNSTLRPGDRMLVVQVTGAAAYSELLNQRTSIDLLNKA